jgi:hypothetical protein
MTVQVAREKGVVSSRVGICDRSGGPREESR